MELEKKKRNSIGGEKDGKNEASSLLKFFLFSEAMLRERKEMLQVFGFESFDSTYCTIPKSLGYCFFFFLRKVIGFVTP